MPCGAFKQQKKRQQKRTQTPKSGTSEMLPNYSRSIVLTQEERDRGKKTHHNIILEAWKPIDKQPLTWQIEKNQIPGQQ